MAETETETPKEQESSGAKTQELERFYSSLAPEVRDRWEAEQIQTIAKTVAKDLNAAEFQMGMAIAAKYDLDPLLKEIWFAKGRTRDGQPGRVLIMVGRDGLLRNARRDPEYQGFDTDVVREKDIFRVRRLAGGGREIHHEYEGSAKKRGAIVGAWAIVRQRGKPDAYFFAPMEEYEPKNSRPDSSWVKQPSVMIQKCALSLCLRLAFNLSGVVGEDEGARAIEDLMGPATTGTTSLEMLEEEIPKTLRARFHAAWITAVEAKPGHYSIPAAHMVLSGQPEETVLSYIEALEKVVADDAAANGEEEIADAEVVPDGEDLGGSDDRPADEDPPGSGAEATGETAGEDSPAAPSQDDAGVDVEALRRRLSDLYDQRDDLGAEDDSRMLDEEIEQVEAKLTAAGGSLPGQESLL